MKLSQAERTAVGIAAALLLFFAGWYARGRLLGGWYTVSGAHPLTEAVTPAPKRTFTPDERLDLNAATLEELTSLPGVGESRAQAILDYRTEHGGFRSAQELTEIPGMGAGIYEGLKDYVTVEDTP